MTERADELEQQLENEISRLRDLAVRSIDPLIVAKAVAASDEHVRTRVLARLRQGERLAEAFAFPGVDANEAQVFFRFVRGEEPRIVDTGMLAFVDLAKGELLGVIDPFDLPAERRVARPFVTISPSDLAAHAADRHAMEQVAEREKEYFERLGLHELARRRPGLEIATVVDTIFGTTTYSGGRDDDTRSDRTQDYRDHIRSGSGDILV